ncbi:MAG: transporter substrate-binding domain-containing protein [Gammaproteobacteria bacterium]|nr:transporter substrate-binding domain-containing protein [Gammaproteobacteria bacterium]MBU2071899.1 transporter substrate-binding domain-containing protein [Gammaproteobacteria bacterium]MBU2181760.1 transporter substrate-binding domain-containing protein [Gammaproteobacteria bacterium]MBU2206348.1 transporter substrate-binding domain-containing protein [Gammaproteobacteria bacterium]
MKLLFALVLAVSLPAQAVACNWRMGIETSFAPYIMQQDDSWRGLNVDLLARLAQQLGCSLEFIHSPWLRSLKLIEQGELDVLSHLSYNQERSAHFAFIGPHQLEIIYLVGVPQAFSGLTDISQLRQKGTSGIIALLNGAYYGDELASILDDAKNRTRFVFIRGNEDKQALLLNGRVHGVLEDITAYHYWKTRSELPTADYLPLFEVHRSTVYFGFSRASFNAEQLQQIADAWQSLYDDGSLAAIVSRYQLEEFRISLPEPAPLLMR